MNFLLFSLAISYIWLRRLIIIPVGVALFAGIIYFTDADRYAGGKSFGASLVAAFAIVTVFFLLTGVVNAVCSLLKSQSMRTGIYQQTFDPIAEARRVSQSNHSRR
jgi:hypothetical protein